MLAKKVLFVLVMLGCIIIPAKAQEKYIFFIEDATYNDLSYLKEMKIIIENSVKGLVIQRNNGGDFGFFKSILQKRPSSIKNSEVPIYEGNFKTGNVYIYGNSEKDGIFYVPSIIFIYGQTPLLNLQSTYQTNIYHMQNIKQLVQEISTLLKRDNIEFIICSWVKNSNKNYEKYIMPFLYYNGREKGIFYSNSTRNKCILDYENVHEIISGNFQNIKIIEGDIEQIYSERIISLKNKRLFLTYFGYFMCMAIILNTIFIKIKACKIVMNLSAFSLVLPFAVLVEPLLGINQISYKILSIITITLLSSIYKRIEFPKYLGVVFLLVIYTDSLFLNSLLRNSLLSYEPALGARFYGIGNEYLGIVLGYILVILFNTRHREGWIIWGLNSLLMLSSFSGNNFGGFLTCICMTAVTSPPIITIIFVLMALVLISLSRNHIYIFFKNILSGNRNYAVSVIKSKLLTFGKLFRFNLWTEITGISLFIYVFMFIRKHLVTNRKFHEFLFCSFLVIIFNDSGIVACALLASIYINYLFYRLSLGEKKWIM